MTAKLRSWWEQILKYWRAIGVVAIVLIVVVVIALIVAVVVSNGTGFNGYIKVSTVHTISGPSAGTVTRTEEYQPGKTLWDLLQLLAALAIPVVVGFGAAWFTAQQGKVSARENTDNQREAALQAYIDKLSELLLKEHLGCELPSTKGELTQKEEEVRKIARVRTLTALEQLDGKRKRIILLFLHESELIDKDKTIIALNGANLDGADLNAAYLEGANLDGVSLKRTDLTAAYLHAASLHGAIIDKAFLDYAILSDPTSVEPLCVEPSYAKPPCVELF